MKLSGPQCSGAGQGGELESSSSQTECGGVQAPSQLSIPMGADDEEDEDVSGPSTHD